MAKKHVDLLQARPQYHSNTDIDKATNLIFAALTTLGEKELKDEKGGYARGFMLIRESSAQSEADSIEKESSTHAFAITTIGRNPINDEICAMDFRFEIQPDDKIKCTSMPPELKGIFPDTYANFDKLLQIIKLFSYLPITKELAKKVSSTNADAKVDNATPTPSLVFQDNKALIDERALRQLFSVKHKYLECLRLDHEKQRANNKAGSTRAMLPFISKDHRTFPKFKTSGVDISNDFGMRSAAQLAYNTWRLALRHSDDMDAALWLTNLETEKQLWDMEQTTLCLGNLSEKDLNECRLSDPIFGNDESQYFSIESQDEMSERQYRLIQLFREKLPSRVDLGVAEDLKKAKDVSLSISQSMEGFLPRDLHGIVMQYTNWPWLAFFSAKSAESKKTERLLARGGDIRPTPRPVVKSTDDADESRKSATAFDLEKEASKHLAGGKSTESIPGSLDASKYLGKVRKTGQYRRRRL